MSSTAARAFVTGGSGLLGKSLISRLTEAGTEVVAQVRSEESARAVEARGARAVHAELLDEDQMAAAMEGADVVYHVAGVNTLCPTDPSLLERVNVEGPKVAVRAAARAGVARLVNTSSAAALGEAEGTVGNEDTPHRGEYRSVYERTKHQGEIAAFETGREVGLDVICVNPSSVQGPGRAGGTGKILLALLDGRLKVFIDTRISVVDIADCTTAHLLAAERGKPGERYVICGASFTSEEAFDILARVGGKPVRPRMLPGPVALAGAAVAEAGFKLARRKPLMCRSMMHTMLAGHTYDGSRATRELGLEYTPVEDTLRRTMEWAEREGLVNRK